MVFYQPQDVRSALLPINSICWFFGMGIIEYPVGYPRRSFSVVYSIAVFTFFLISTFVSRLNNSSSEIPIDPFVNRGNIIGYSLTVTCVCCNIVFGIIYSKKRSDCIVTLEKINGIMERMGIVRSYQSVLVAQIWQFGTLVLAATLSITMTFIDSFSSDRMPKTYLLLFISIQYPVVISTSYEIMFCSFHTLITCAFKDLNSLLESLRFKLADESQHTRNDSVSRQKRGLKMVYSIRKIYSRLVWVTKQWNHLNGVFVFTDSAFIVLCLSNNICIVYGILERSEIDSTNVWLIANTLMASSLSVGKLVMIVRSTVRLTFEANRTCEIVLQYLHPIASLRSEVRTFSMQLTHNRLRLSVLGLHPLDYSLIQEIFTSIVTYAIVIIQISGPRKGDENQKQL